MVASLIMNMIFNITHDYGPMHSFWLYSFERMNGVLGSVNTNQRSVEIQLMRKMSQCQAIAIFERPELYSDIFGRVFEYETDKTIKNYKAVEVQRVLGLSANQVSDNKAWFQTFDIKFIGSRQNVYLTDHKVDHLRRALQTFCNVDPVSVSGSCHKYKHVEIFGEKYGSSDSRLSRSSVIMASWCGTDGEIDLNGNDERCGIVRFYMTVFLPIDGSTARLTLAYIHWFQKVYCQKSISSVASVWCHKLFEPEGPACFMPVQRIASKCICAKVIIKNEELLAVVPFLRQLYW